MGFFLPKFLIKKVMISCSDHQLPIRITITTLVRIQVLKCESITKIQTLEHERHVQQHQEESKLLSMKDALVNINKNPNSRTQRHIQQHQQESKLQSMKDIMNYAKKQKNNVSTKLANTQIQKKVKLAQMWNILKPKLMQNSSSHNQNNSIKKDNQKP